jgi:L-Ala-D/L-Glu epimerase
MAPSLLLATRCRFVDLDGPPLQAEDLDGGLVYHGGYINPAKPGFWG